MNVPLALPTSWPRWLRRTVRIAAWTIAVVLVLAGLAAALLPRWLNGFAVDQIREQLQREATIETISINPFRLSARVTGLAIKDRDGKSPLLGFDELYTRVGFTSIFRLAPVIDELKLVKPQVHLARLDAEHYNITDIVERMLAKPSDPAGPRFALNSLAVTDGTLTFDDRPAGKVHKVERLTLKLPELSAFEADRNEFAQPSLSAVVNGDPLELSGRTKPFAESLETNVSLHLSDVDVPSYLGYSPVALPIRVEKGVLATKLDIALRRAKDQSWSATVSGTLRLDDLALRDPAAAERSSPVAAVKSIDVTIGELRWPQGTIRIDRIAIDAPQVLARREADGTINWQNMLAKATPADAKAAEPRNVKATEPAKPTATPAPPAATDRSTATNQAPAADKAPAWPPPWRWTLADVALTDGTIAFEDLAAPAGPFRSTLKPVAVKVANLSNADNAEANVELTLATDGNEQLTHTAKLTLSPLAIGGQVALQRVRIARYQPYAGGTLAADVDGLADIELRYALAADGDFTVTEGRLSGTNLVLKDRKRGDIARINALAVSGIDLDVDKRSVTLGSVALRQCRASLVRDQGGRINVASLLRTGEPATPHATAVGPATPAARQAPEKEWAVAVKQATLERCSVQFDDLAAGGAGEAGAVSRTVLDPLDVRVDDWSLAANHRARVDVRSLVNRKGRVSMKGTAGASPIVADLDVAVDGLELVPFQPYVADQLNIRIGSGGLSTRGKLALSAKDALAVRYRGDASLARLASTTKADGDDFLNWGALQARGIDIAVNGPAPGGSGGVVPFGMALDEVALSDFYSRLIINADGTLNVQHIVREAGGDRAQSAAAAAGVTPAAPGASGTASDTRSTASSQTAATAAPVAAATPPAPITIKRVSLGSGRINFSDRFIKPNYSADILDVNGTVEGLSSDLATRATVDLHGRYEPSAPVEIKGTINPLSGNLFVDIAASCRDVELVQFTPYAQKYAGYGITKGKLALEVKYLIENRKLTADNKLLLEQLTFGEKVESPDATKLPVLFAVSLLKNAKGEIDLNLPISGSLDDPQFSVFAIVLKIIGNLLVKAATAPFALIGALVGGGEDLAYVDFAPGAAGAVAADQKDKLAKVAKALVDRPALKLDIAGRVDPATDTEALRRRALLRKLAALRGDDAVPAGSGESISIPPEEFAALLKRAYDSAQPKPSPAGGTPAATPPAAPKDVPIAEMERAVLAGIAIAPEDLANLAERRANAAKNALALLGVPSERMFIVASVPKEGSEAKAAPRVDFVLK